MLEKAKYQMDIKQMNIKNIARDKLTTNLDKIGRTVCAIRAVCAPRDRIGGVLFMLALLCGLLATTAPLQAALTFDFESGMQGWTNVATDVGNYPKPEFFSVANPAEDGGGTDVLAPNTWGTRDQSHARLEVRSPYFMFAGSSNVLSFQLSGGKGSDVAATASGFMGVAVRRTSDQAYILSARRSGTGASYQTRSFTAAEIAAATAGDADDEIYALYLIDNFVGGWGWTCLDNVSIPGFTTWGDNAGVSNVTATTADAYATLRNANFTNGSLYWDTTDKGENFAWTYTNVLSSLSTGLVESTISGLTPDTTYYARFYGTNSTAGIGEWSDVISFHSAFAPTSFDYKRQITFTNFSGRGTLTNFPALVKFNANDNVYAGFKSADAHDLRFCSDEDGTGELNYEIEKWNTNGESFVWVQVPELTHNGSIWAYWGRTGAVQPAYATNGATWDSNFRGVWHLSDTNSAGKLPDSTGNPNDGTNFDTVNVENQVIGDAQLFTGDYIDCGTDPSLDLTTALTVSAWGYFENNDNAGFVYAGGGWNTAGYGLHAFGGGLLAEFRGGGTASTANNPKPTEDQWTHVTATWDNIGQTIRVYYNGVQQANTAARTAVNAIGTNFKIGKANSGNFDGMIDEVRAEAVSRSSNWVWACYQNQGANHDSFTEYGRVINIGGTVILVR
jgi:hypothetical protein